MAATAIRQGVWRDGGRADGWHEDVAWYAAAIYQMKLATPELEEWHRLLELLRRGQGTQQHWAGLLGIIASWSDPRGLGYQSQVHGTFLEAPEDWPSHDGQRALWQQCAHNHWFFLPWHRAYLLEFESVARQHLLDLGLPAESWGLPYWNYSDYLRRPEALTLPLPLRSRVLPDDVDVPGVEPDGSGERVNPLFDEGRVMKDEPADLEDPPGNLWADASDALNRPHYATRNDVGLVSFGGGYLEISELFHRADEPGLLDVQPHGSVHGQVAGNMGEFETAGLDPVFWMHHANIDRLWETYARDMGRGYPFEGPDVEPTDARDSWMNDEFVFLRPAGDPGKWRPVQVVDVETLGYRYDTTAEPEFVPLAPIPPGADDDPFGFAPDEAAPQPVAAALDVSISSTLEVQLTSGPSPEGDFGVAEEAPVGRRWVLRLDGIRASAPAVTNYLVFLGLEPGASADPYDRAHYVGLLSLFGVFEGSRNSGASSSSGRVRFFDATAQVQLLGADLDPLHPVIRLVPLNPSRDLEAMGLTVERITLEVA